MNDFASDITHITYKEVQILWGMNPQAAANRLCVIRSMLKKSRMQRLTVLQYCNAEGISTDEFYQAINKYYSRIHKKAS